jgi:hypothetical protein
MKQLFSRQFKLSLEKTYNGRLPSLAVIARDLSLKSPHLPHVSNEAVRKWLRGSAIPQSPRMQTLVDWLGEELLEPLAKTKQTNGGNGNGSNSLNGWNNAHERADALNKQALFTLIDSLEPADYKLMVRLIRSLSEKAKAGRAIDSEPLRGWGGG